MKTILIILKQDLEPYPNLSKQLVELSIRVKEEANHYVYQPADGKVMEFIILLQSRQVSYTLQFDKTSHIIN